jgi:hypothetical protein
VDGFDDGLRCGLEATEEFGTGGWNIRDLLPRHGGGSSVEKDQQLELFLWAG